MTWDEAGYRLTRTEGRMRRKIKPLNWKRIWHQFEEWHESEQDKVERCKSCGHKPYCDADDWEEQQKAIRRLVEAARRPL